MSNVTQRFHQSEPKHDHEVVTQEEVVYVIIPTVTDRFTNIPALQNQYVAEKWKDVDVISLDRDEIFARREAKRTIKPVEASKAKKIVAEPIADNNRTVEEVYVQLSEKEKKEDHSDVIPSVSTYVTNTLSLDEELRI
ncbi:hypothetical protein LIER_13350 [Lithospermum erythrorhizon]|uniref:Uncharacterized protein n=1 Tax=Lithospermum erythrorhizon TaxID=34254 RepID=A0AAV3PV88_LITER